MVQDSQEQQDLLVLLEFKEVRGQEDQRVNQDLKANQVSQEVKVSLVPKVLRAR